MLCLDSYLLIDTLGHSFLNHQINYKHLFGISHQYQPWENMMDNFRGHSVININDVQPFPKKTKIYFLFYNCQP